MSNALNNTSLLFNCTAETIGTPKYAVLVVSLLVLFGFTGNSLVCLSILLEKRLQNATNYFLFSLAVADLMVSVLVMPFSIAMEFSNGYWQYGFVGCLIYTSLDVFLCSLSMWHMTAIALDRHRGISHPFKARNKTKTGVCKKILIVWLMAFVISSPITILGAVNPGNIWSECICGIFPNYNIAIFQIYGTILSFVIPSVIMIHTYLKTLAKLRMQMKLVGGNSPTLRRNTGRSRSGSSVNTLPLSKKKSGSGVKGCLDLYEEQSTTHVSAVVAMQQIHRLYSDIILDRKLKEDEHRKRKLSTKLLRTKPKPSVRNDMRRAATLYYLKSRKDSAVIVSREQKATYVLGIVFFSFFFCWSPFFMSNLILAICGERCSAFPHIVASIFLWLGYISSVINPMIYTAFNETFRLTFWRIMGCRCRLSKRSNSDVYTSMRSAPELTADNSFLRIKYSILSTRSMKPTSTKEPKKNSIRKSKSVTGAGPGKSIRLKLKESTKFGKTKLSFADRDETFEEKPHRKRGSVASELQQGSSNAQAQAQMASLAEYNGQSGIKDMKTAHFCDKQLINGNEVGHHFGHWDSHL